MVTEARQRFNAKLDKAKAALEPLFDTAYSTLSADEIEVLHEVSYKLGGARMTLIDGDFTPAQMERQYQEQRAERAARIAIRNAHTAVRK